MKLGLWNLGANVTNIQGGRGKRKWTHKIKEPNKKKHYNQNTLTEIPGFERKIQEKIAQPKTEDGGKYKTGTTQRHPQAAIQSHELDRKNHT